MWLFARINPRKTLGYIMLYTPFFILGGFIPDIPRLLLTISILSTIWLYVFIVVRLLHNGR